MSKRIIFLPKNKKKVLIKLLILFICVGGIYKFLTWFSGPPTVYFNLYMFEKRLTELPLPDKTVRIGKSYREFGLLGPTGNHCDYAVDMLIKSELSATELRKHFEKFSLPAIIPNEMMQYSDKKRGDEPNQIGVSQEWKPWKPTGVDAREKDFIESAKKSASATFEVPIEEINENVYQVGSSDSGYSARYWQCH